jgi:hypothetical protein
MNGLDTHARAILDAARHADDPTHRQRERTARAMALRFGFGTAALTTATSGWAALAAAKIWVPAVLVVASGAGGAVWFESKRPPAAAASMVAAPTSTSAATAPAIVDNSDPPAPVKEESPEGTEATGSQRGSSKAVRPKEAAIATSNHLQEETALLAEVNGALGAGQLRGALDLLDTYDRRYPNGVLREESSATRVVVLCQLEHGPRAAALAKRFLTQHASSPLVPRVQRACAGQIP